MSQNPHHFLRDNNAAASVNKAQKTAKNEDGRIKGGGANYVVLPR